MAMKNLRTPYRVMLVDDHKLVGEMLGLRLGGENQIQVVGIASDGAGAEHILQEQEVDIVLLDMELAQEDGLGLARRLLELRPLLRIVGLSVHDHDHYPLALLRLGAVGFLSKRCSGREIADGVRRVGQGEMAVSPAVAAYLATQKMVHSPIEWLARLTPKETDVLSCLARGMSIPAIAERLGLTVKTVQTHRKHLRHKLGVNTDVELCLLAIKAGLLDLHRVEPGKP